MKPKWLPITEKFELNDMAIVTRHIKGQKDQKLLDVTIGFPGWGLQNGAVAYMPLPRDIIQDPTAWKSEYRGDELPSKDIPCMVHLQGAKADNDGKYRILDSYYLAKENRFLRIPNGWEVIAWMEYPKPYGTM